MSWLKANCLAFFFAFSKKNSKKRICSVACSSWYDNSLENGPGQSSMLAHTLANPYLHSFLNLKLAPILSDFVTRAHILRKRLKLIVLLRVYDSSKVIYLA